MGSYITRQPNGLLCRFSSIVDTVTHHNMTEDEYIEICAERGRKEAVDVIENHLQPFERIKEDFRPNNCTQKEFDELINMMGKPVK